MGLDSVDLILEIEKCFDITIPDQEAEKITTIGKMYDAVWQHLEGKSSNKCNSQILFYRLRKSAAEIFNFPKQQFLLDAVPEDVFPKENRREIYKEFGNINNLFLPDLLLAKPWSVFLKGFGVVTILGTLFYAIISVIFYDNSNCFFLLPICGLLLTSLLSKAVDTKRIIISENTVRIFVEKTLVLNYEKLSKENGYNRKEVEMIINQIIVDKIGVDEDEISPEKNFADDLGVD
jgi:acyl carrier protein